MAKSKAHAQRVKRVKFLLKGREHGDRAVEDLDMSTPKALAGAVCALHGVDIDEYKRALRD